MPIGLRTILQVVDMNKKYTSGCLLPGESTKDVWHATLKI